MRTGCGTAKVSSLGPQRPCAPQAFADPSASTGLPDRCSGRGCPCPRSRRRRPAEPWMAKRSRLSSERKARRAAANVRRWGMGSPGPRVTCKLCGAPGCRSACLLSLQPQPSQMAVREDLLRRGHVACVKRTELRIAGARLVKPHGVDDFLEEIGTPGP